MMEFVKGQKAKLSDLGAGSKIEIGIDIAPGSGQSIDVSCFGLDEAGKLSDERYMIFYNQRLSPCGGIEQCGSRNGFRDFFTIDFQKLATTIRRLVFTATIDGTGNMSSTGASRLVIFSDGQPKVSFAFTGQTFVNEKAVMIAEIYSKDVWRFAANGQGFAGGLNALVAHFGGTVADSNNSRPAPSQPPAPAPTPLPPERPKVNISKVSLDKRGASATVDLRKGGGKQPIYINLNWNKPEKGFFSFMQAEAADLDLGCMFLLQDGSKGVIQPLGNSFGSRDSAPYIFLDKDDRTGQAADGENMCIYRPDQIKLVVVFAMIYEGTDNFTTVGGKLTIKDTQGSEITIPLNNPDSRRLFCAVAHITQTNSQITITKDELYFSNHQECDKHYGFGFRWVAGSK
jgi:tellurite resistance protein TerA